MDRQEILQWIREQDSRKLEELWRRAEAVRQQSVGDAVHLRGLIEISNCCVRQCAYCGLRAGNSKLERYRMTPGEIIQCAGLAARYGYGTVVLQSGEDHQLTAEWVSELVCCLKAETPLAVTLSLGERSPAELAAWREAGADRYLLRFETSDRELYDRIHPGLSAQRSDRIALLRELRQLGYETGSGIMIGIPGQSDESLADDVLLFRELALDMIGVGPFLAHPDTPLGQGPVPSAPEQVPNSELMAYKVIALMRIAGPLVNIPATTALACVNPLEGYETGLRRGANVIMPNLTPPPYRRRYEVYPAKGRVGASAEVFNRRIGRRICTIGRTVGTGRGDSLNLRKRSDCPESDPGAIRCVPCPQRP